MRSISLRLLLRHLHHTVLFLLVWVVFLNGCSSWRTLEKPPTESNPQEVLVTLKDESQITLLKAYASADTLFGYESDRRALARILSQQELQAISVNPSRQFLIAIPIKDVAFIEERYSDGGKTMLAVVGGLVVVGGVALFIAFESACFGGFNCD